MHQLVSTCPEPVTDPLFGAATGHPMRRKAAGLDAALDAWNVAVIELGAERCITAMTAATARILGREAEEVVGRPIGAVLPEVEALVAGAADGRAEAVVALEHPCGGVTMVRVHVATVAESGDGLVLLSPRAGRADDEFLFGEAEQRSPVMRLDTDLHGRLLQATARLCQWLGLTVDQLRRHALSDIVHADDRGAVTEALAALRDGAETDFSRDLRFVDRAGSVRWGRIDATVVRDRDGRPRRMLAYVRDIGERKRLERELRHSRDFLEQVTENVTNALAVIDREGRFTWVNRWVGTITGYAADALIGQHFGMLFEPPVLPEIEALFVDVSRRGESVVGHEAPIVREDGERRHVVFNALPLRYNGTLGAVVVTAEDITARKRADAERQRSEEGFREAFAHVPVGMAIMDLEGHFLHVNSAYCRIVGYSADELLADWDFRRLTHPADLEENLRAYDRLLSGEVPAFFMEKRYVRKDGRVVWVRTSTSLRRDAEGRPLHMVGMVEDIDERVQGEEEHLILEGMMEHIPMGIAIADAPDLRIRAVSRFGRDMLGCDAVRPGALPEPGHSRCWHMVRAGGPVPADPGELPLTRAIRHGEHVHEEEWALVRGDGSQVPILCTASPICDHHDHIIAGVVGWQDISRRKQMEQALRHMNAELEEFAFIASHDLKAPLRAVANLATWIDEDAGVALDRENRDRLRLMRERIVGMNKLIEGLLGYARLGRAGAPEREDVPLADLLRTLVAELVVPEGFRIDIDEASLPVLRADPLQLRQIFQNLLGNAIHHHDRPGEGHLSVRAYPDGNGWCIEVADDGPGIPATARERVFKMFATSDSGGHTGIGLAVVRKIIRANGGTIEVEDNAPRGARFRIRWPR